MEKKKNFLKSHLMGSEVLCVRGSRAITKYQLKNDVNGAEITNAISKIDWTNCNFLIVLYRTF